MAFYRGDALGAGGCGGQFTFFRLCNSWHRCCLSQSSRVLRGRPTPIRFADRLPGACHLSRPSFDPLEGEGRPSFLVATPRCRSGHCPSTARFARAQDEGLRRSGRRAVDETRPNSRKEHAIRRPPVRCLSCTVDRSHACSLRSAVWRADSPPAALRALLHAHGDMPARRTPSETWEPNPCREVTAALPIPGPEPVPARAMGEE